MASETEGKDEDREEREDGDDRREREDGEEREGREGEDEQKPRRRRRWRLIAGAGLAALVIVVVAVIVSSSGSSTKNPAKGPTTGGVQARGVLGGIPQHGMTLGASSAKVTVLEFADLQCPFCRDYTMSVFPRVASQYVRTGKAKLEFHNFPFLGPQSIPAARAVVAAARQNRAWNFVDVWYQNQGPENSGYATDSFTRKIAREAGLKVAPFMTARDSPAAKSALHDDAAIAKYYHVGSTPTFVLRGSSGRTLQVTDYTQLPAAIQSLLSG